MKSKKLIKIALLVIFSMACFVFGVACGKSEPIVKNPAIELSKDSITVSVGQNFTLETTVQDWDGGIEWKSSDTNIATVGIDGIVYAIGLGQTEIIVKAGAATDVCICTVIGDTSLIDFSYENVSEEKEIGLYVGDAFTVLIKDSGKFEEITYTSRNPDIATVSNNVITGVAIGNAIVDVVAKRNGSILCDSLAITIMEGSSLLLSQTKIELFVGQTAEIFVSALIDNGNDITETEKANVIWFSENEDTVTVSNGLITATEIGEFIIGASYTCASGFVLETRVRVVVYEPNENQITKGLNDPSTNWGDYDYQEVWKGNVVAGRHGIKIKQYDVKPSGYLDPELLKAAYENGYRYLTVTYVNGKGAQTGYEPWVTFYYGSDIDGDGVADKNKAFQQQAGTTFTLQMEELKGDGEEFNFQINIMGGWIQQGEWVGNYDATITELRFETGETYLSELLALPDRNFASQLAVWKGNTSLSGESLVVTQNSNEADAVLSSDLLKLAEEAGYNYLTVTYSSLTRFSNANGFAYYSSVSLVGGNGKELYYKQSKVDGECSDTIKIFFGNLKNEDGTFTFYINCSGGWQGSLAQATFSNIQFTKEDVANEDKLNVLLSDPTTNYAAKVELWSGNVAGYANEIVVTQNNDAADAILLPKLLKLAYEAGYRYIKITYGDLTRFTGASGFAYYASINCKGGEGAASLYYKQSTVDGECADTIKIALEDLKCQDGSFSLAIDMSGGWSGNWSKGTLKNVWFEYEETLEDVVSNPTTNYATMLDVWTGSVAVSNDKLVVTQANDVVDAVLSSELLTVAYNAGYTHIQLTYTDLTRFTGASGFAYYASINCKGGEGSTSLYYKQSLVDGECSDTITIALENLKCEDGSFVLIIECDGGWSGYWAQASFSNVQFIKEA